MQSITQTASNAALEAGKILKQDFYHSAAYQNKGKHDVVTETDLRSEKILLQKIREVYPEHTIISEELGKEVYDSEYCWYIDPLDGTSNFITGNPYFAVSIGVAFKGEIMAGVVYNPLMEELYLAEKGAGAYLNNVPLAVSTTDKMEDALIATAYAAGEEEIQEGVRILQRVAMRTRRVVLNFAPALDLCNIARGRIDGIIDNGSTPEDHAAASLIVNEAGGTLQNLHRDTWDVNITGIVASNGLIQEDLLCFV